MKYVNMKNRKKLITNSSSRFHIHVYIRIVHGSCIKISTRTRKIINYFVELKLQHIELCWNIFQSKQNFIKIYESWMFSFSNIDT